VEKQVTAKYSASAHQPLPKKSPQCHLGGQNDQPKLCSKAECNQTTEFTDMGWEWNCISHKSYTEKVKLQYHCQSVSINLNQSKMWKYLLWSKQLRLPEATGKQSFV